MLVVDTVFVLAIVAAGVLTKTSGGDERSRYTVSGLLPRLIVGFVAAHVSQLWCGMLIDLANALNATLTARQRGQRRRTAGEGHIAAGQDKSAVLLLVICVAIIAVRSWTGCLWRGRRCVSLGKTPQELTAAIAILLEGLLSARPPSAPRSSARQTVHSGQEAGSGATTRSPSGERR